MPIRHAVRFSTDMRYVQTIVCHLECTLVHLVTQFSETPDWAPCSSWLVNQVKRDYMRFHNNLRWKKLKNNLELKTNNQDLTDAEVRSSWLIGPRQLVCYRLLFVFVCLRSSVHYQSSFGLSYHHIRISYQIVSISYVFYSKAIFLSWFAAQCFQLCIDNNGARIPYWSPEFIFV